LIIALVSAVRASPISSLKVAEITYGNLALYWQYAERRHGDITVNNNRLIGIALLVVGVILLVMGYNATQAPVEELAESFTGRYSDETMYYLIGGAAAAVIGVVMLLRK
jgi:hypothetical protein